MKGYYCVDWKKNGIKQGCQRYFTFKKAREEARKLLAAQFPNIEQYTAPIRNGVNTGYRNAVADYVDGFFKDPDFFDKEYRFAFDDDPEDYAEAVREWNEEYKKWDEVIPEDSLEDVANGRDDGMCIWLGSNGGLELVSGHWLQEVYENDYLELKCEGLSVGINISFEPAGLIIEKKKNLHNIFLVWAALDACYDEGSLSVDDICQTIRYVSFVEISPNTVRAQIKNLKKLGFRVQEEEERSTPDDVSPPQVRMRYSVADDDCGAAQKGDFGRSEYPMMVYLVLRDSDVPLSQQAILDAISERFGVKLQRQTVGRHVGFLREMGCKIIDDGKNGYKLYEE